MTELERARRRRELREGELRHAARLHVADGRSSVLSLAARNFVEAEEYESRVFRDALAYAFQPWVTAK